MTAEILQLTAAAKIQIAKMLQKNQATKLRLAIKDTGCSGKSYHLSVIETTNTQDHIVTLDNGAILCIDVNSYELVKGTCMDYHREGLNAKFTFTNPQSKGTCGCGESFYV